MVSFEDPYEIAKEDLPAWLREASPYNGRLDEQTPEQMEWIVQVAPRLMYFELWESRPRIEKPATFSIDDAESVSIEIPEEYLSQVLEMPGFAELNETRPWKKEPYRSSWWTA